MQSLKINDFFHALRDISKPSQKAAITLAKSDVKLLKSLYSHMAKELKEEVDFIPNSICTKSADDFPLHSKVMSALTSSGILQQRLKHFYEFELRPQIEPEEGPQVLSYSDCEFGFIIWLVCCGISTLTFLFELAHFHALILMKKIFGFYILLKTFRDSKVFMSL